MHFISRSDINWCSGNGENGGVSSSAPAVGANADQGGNSESSSDGDPEDGVDVDKIIETVSFAGMLLKVNQNRHFFSDHT